jgi:hypothetical protein
MSDFNSETLYHSVDKDILYYLHATERDQWDDFVLNDDF